MNTFIAVALIAIAPSLPWRAVGRAEAERDIAAGTMKLKIYGYFAGFRDVDRVARVNLRDRLGLELEAVAQCVVTRDLVEHAEGYNDRIQQEMEARHGVGVIDEVWAKSSRESQPELVAHDWLMRVVPGGLLVVLVVYRRVLFPARTVACPREPR